MPQVENLEKKISFSSNSPERLLSPDDIFISEFQKISLDFYTHFEIQTTVSSINEIVLPSYDFAWKPIISFSNLDNGMSKSDFLIWASIHEYSDRKQVFSNLNGTLVYV